LTDFYSIWYGDARWFPELGVKLKF